MRSRSVVELGDPSSRIWLFTVIYFKNPGRKRHRAILYPHIELLHSCFAHTTFLRSTDRMTNALPRAFAPVRASSPTMSANRRTPPPIPTRPSINSRQYQTSSSSNAPVQPQLQVNTSSTSRRPEIRSATSSFSNFTASASSWASKAKSGAKIGLNNYAKPMAKAALVKGSNYVGAASEYLQDARGSEGVSRSISEDDSLDTGRARKRSPEPVDKLHLLPQWAVRKARRDKDGKVVMDENGKPLRDLHACTHPFQGKPQYDLEVHVSGYCGSVTSAENAGLILKAALKIMKGTSSVRPLIII